MLKRLEAYPDTVGLPQKQLKYIFNHKGEEKGLLIYQQVQARAETSLIAVNEPFSVLQLIKNKANLHQNRLRDRQTRPFSRPSELIKDI